jgi:hypothetical protein
MMRKNNNNGGNRNKHRGNSGGGRRYNNNGGGNRGGHNDGQNIARQKHHATQMLGKFSDMARNAQSNGDRVDVEYYLQHVEHYSRVLAEIAGVEAERFAHSREQYAPQGDVAGGEAANAEPTSEGNADAATTNNEGSEGQGSYQPRQRHHRHRAHGHHSAPASDNGAVEANANKEEIPLPGNILPPI